jgi:hypothetical protein
VGPNCSHSGVALAGPRRERPVTTEAQGHGEIPGLYFVVCGADHNCTFWVELAFRPASRLSKTREAGCPSFRVVRESVGSSARVPNSAIFCRVGSCSSSPQDETIPSPARECWETCPKKKKSRRGRQNVLPPLLHHLHAHRGTCNRAHGHQQVPVLRPDHLAQEIKALAASHLPELRETDCVAPPSPDEADADGN